MHLTTFISRPDESGKTKTCLGIMIDYDHKDNTVKEILAVYACNVSDGKMIDLTDVFVMDISAGLEKLISSVDWREIYREEVKKAA